MLDNYGFTLTELLIVVAILGLIVSAGALSFGPLLYNINASLTLRQLQQTIHYARSQAITKDQTVTICPSYDRFSCSGNWQHGMLVAAPNSTGRFFPVYMGSKCMLFLTQSGFSNDKVIVHPNGLTNTNGHFSYKCLNASNLPQYTLYFNKGLRIYWGL